MGTQICWDVSYVVVLHESISPSYCSVSPRPHNLHTWLISNPLQGVSQMFDQLVKRSNWVWIYKTGRFAIEGVHGGIGVHGDCGQLYVRRFPYPLPQGALQAQQLLRYAQMQRRGKPPEHALPGQACHLQHPGQHLIVGHKADVIEAGEPNVDGQDHRQHELIDGHNTRDAPHPQCFLDQLLETQLLQHRRHWEQTTVGGEILTVEVERGGSRDFIGFRNIYLRALLGAEFAAMLLFVLHLLGDLLEIGSRSCYFAASLFYNRISRVPKGFASSAPLQPLKCCA